MKRVSIFLLALSALLVVSCNNAGKSFKDIEGIWVMDSGVEEYINKAGFEIKNTGKGYFIFLGEINDGKLNQQEDPAPLVQKGNEFIVNIPKGSTLKLIPDAGGVKLLGFTGNNKGSDFHFKKIEKTP